MKQGGWEQSGVGGRDRNTTGEGQGGTEATRGRIEGDCKMEKHRLAQQEGGGEKHAGTDSITRGRRFKDACTHN